MAVNCLDTQQKQFIAHHYNAKLFTQKELARMSGVSERTINRVLIEAGLATPVARVKGEAYQVMQLLKAHALDLPSLRALLEGTHATSK